MSYSPTLGRWVQQDPAGYVDGANLYQALVSNPVSLVDPMGAQPTRPTTTKPTTNPATVGCPPSPTELREGIAVPVDADGDGNPEYWKYPTAQILGDPDGMYELRCYNDDSSFYVLKGDKFVHRCPWPKGQNSFERTRNGYIGQSVDPQTGTIIQYKEVGENLEIVVQIGGIQDKKTVTLPTERKDLPMPTEVVRPQPRR